MAVSRTVLRSIAGIERHGGGNARRQSAAVRRKRPPACSSPCFTACSIWRAASCAIAMPATTRPICCAPAAGARCCTRPASRSASIPAGSYRIGESVLLPGDALFLYSDGITEAFNPAGEIYGNDRLEGVLDRRGGRSAAEIVGDVLAETAALPPAPSSPTTSPAWRCVISPEPTGNGGLSGRRNLLPRLRHFVICFQERRISGR